MKCRSSFSRHRRSKRRLVVYACMVLKCVGFIKLRKDNVALIKTATLFFVLVNCAVSEPLNITFHIFSGKENVQFLRHYLVHRIHA